MQVAAPAYRALASRRVVRSGPAQFAATVTGAVAGSYLPVLAGVTTRSAVGWIVAVAVAVLLAWLTRHLEPNVLVTALVLSSALVPSGLVNEATHYMPVAVTGGALALRVVLDVREYGRTTVPPLPIVVTVGLYLAWAALATLTSVDHRVSAVYLVGMVAVCGLGFWIIPVTLLNRPDRERLLAGLGVLGVVVAVSVYVISVAGGFTVFGRQVGFYRVLDLTLGGSPTGIHFGYSSGAYLTPLEPSVLMVIGILGLLGWSSSRAGRDVRLAWIAIVFMIPAILITLDRSAWLAAAVGAGVFTALAYLSRIRVAIAAFVFVFFAACFLLVAANFVGANGVSNTPCTSGCAAGSDETPIRGGTGLSGREYLWKWSLTAIKHRPVLGWGPGNDIRAIDQYMTNDAVQAGFVLTGLTSHSTWFRTAVEMGVPGLLLLIAAGLGVAWVFIQSILRTRKLPDATRIAFAAAVCGLLPAMTFETFLLGGVTFSSLILAVAAGLTVGPVAEAP